MECAILLYYLKHMTVPFLSYNNYFYDDLHYFVLDCKKTAKYYMCTICNVLALKKKITTRE